jgi:hypothetical protein
MGAVAISPFFYDCIILVIGKGGNDPRLEDDASAQIFKAYTCLVIGGYANYFAERSCVRFFDTFPDPYPD